MNKKTSFIHILFLIMLATGFCTLGFAQNVEVTKANKNLQIQSTEGEDLRKALQVEMLINKSEEQAMAQLNKLIAANKGKSLEPNLLFRKAELYMRKSKTDRFFEMNRDSDKVVSFAPELAKSSDAKNNIKKAIDVYEDIQKRFPRFMQLDYVLFNNAFSRQQLNDNANAKKLYNFMLKEFPDSVLVPEAYLAIGEMYFSANDFKMARDYFERIISYPNSRIYPYGRYKLAWTYYNLSLNKEALVELETVVAYSNSNEQQNFTRIDLRKEALGDMVLFYSDVHSADKAVAYFRKQSSDAEAGVYLLGLASLYKRHGKYAFFEVVLKDLIKALPTASQLPIVYRDLIDGLEEAKLRKNIISELNDFYKICDLKSNWFRTNTEKYNNNLKLYQENPEAYYKPDMPECQNIFDRVSSNLAVKYDKTFKNNPNDKAIAELADSAYRIYLQRAEGKEKESAMRYSFADLLFRLNKFEEASSEYFKVAQKEKDSKIIHDASYAAIFSLQKSVNDKWTDIKDEKRYVELSKFYIEKNPKGQYVESIEFKRAFIIYENSRFDEAAPYLKEIGDKYAKSAQGQKAQDLYLDILNSKKDFNGIKNYTKLLLLKNPVLERKNALQVIYEQAYFSEIQAMDTKKSSKQSIDEYLKFAKENPKSNLAEKAEWNAIQLIRENSDYKQLGPIAEAYSKKYSNNKKEAILLAAQSYEASANLLQAIVMIQSLRIIDAENKFKWIALQAHYEWLENRNEDARKNYEELLKSNKQEHQIEAWQALAKIDKDSGNPVAYNKILSRIAQSAPAVLAVQAKTEMAEQFFYAKDNTKAFSMASEVVGDKQADKNLKSRARFVQAQILDQEFISQSVKAKADRIAMVLAIKTEKLEKAQTAYQQAIKYGDPRVAIQAFVKLANAYGNYAKSIRAIKLSEDVSPTDAQAFYDEMENLAIPMEEKEVESLQEALKQSKRLSLRDDSIQKIQIQLDELNKQTSIYKNYQVKPTDMRIPLWKANNL